MNIIEDRSYFEKDSKLWLDAGLAKETAYMLRFSYCLTDEERRREELACIGKTSEERCQLRQEAARVRSECMKALMDNIAARFVVFRYADAEPMPQTVRSGNCPSAATGRTSRLTNGTIPTLRSHSTGSSRRIGGC